MAGDLLHSVNNSLKKHALLVYGRFAPLVWLFVFCGVLYLLFMVRYVPVVDFSETVPFEGDQRSYQSLAVNLVKGEGYLFGGRGDFEEYRYDLKLDEVDMEKDADFFNNEDVRYGLKNINFNRAPGYPFFVAGIYGIWGVEPVVVRYVQLLLLIFSACAMPIVGFLYFGRNGVLAGAITSYVFLDMYARQLSSPILAEALAVWITVWLIISIGLFESKRTPSRAALVGILTAVAVLVKPLLAFVPLMLLLYWVWLFARRKMNLQMIISCLVPLCLILFGWAIYASLQSNSLVFISTQTETALLECNNELTIGGRWRKTGYRSDDPDLFYNREDIKDKATFGKLLSFYWEYREKLPQMIWNKLRRGFNQYSYAKLILVFVIWSSVVTLARKFPRFTHLWMSLTFFVHVGVFFLVVGIFLGASRFGLVESLLHINILAIVTAMAWIVSTVLTKKTHWPVHYAFSILILNFIMVAALFVGESRYIGIIDLVFMFLAINFIVHWIGYNWPRLRSYLLHSGNWMSKLG